VRLAPALDTGLFSEAERSALRLDGECVPLGLTVIPVDVPVDATVRAASLSAAVARYDLVVDLRTAAWVHGALPSLPRSLTLAVDIDRARRTKLIRPAPREARFRADDVARLGGVLVTTPLKTAFDLLRLEDGADTAAVALLLLRGEGVEPVIAAALAQLQPGCPHKQRGIDRLAGLSDQPADTR
jgi:hypothetical protein